MEMLKQEQAARHEASIENECRYPSVTIAIGARQHKNSVSSPCCTRCTALMARAIAHPWETPVSPATASKCHKWQPVWILMINSICWSHR